MPSISFRLDFPFFCPLYVLLKNSRYSDASVAYRRVPYFFPCYLRVFLVLMAPTQPKSRPSSDATSRLSGGLKKKTHGSSIKAPDPRNTILGKLDPSRISVQIDVDSASTASISSIPLPFPPQSTQSDPSGQSKHDGSQKKLTDEIFVAPSPRTNRVGQPALSPSRSSSSPSVAPSNTLESNTEGNEAEKKKAEEKNNEEKEDGKKKADENEAETKKMEEQKKPRKKKRQRERNHRRGVKTRLLGAMHRLFLQLVPPPLFLLQRLTMDGFPIWETMMMCPSLTFPT